MPAKPSEYHRRIACAVQQMHEQPPEGAVERVLVALVGEAATYERTLAALRADYPSEARLRAAVERLEALIRSARLAPDSFTLLGAVQCKDKD